MMLRAAQLTVLAGAALVAVPAGPAAAAACPSDQGVTVVVDFAALGGGTSRQCAAGDPSSGLAALRGAGFSTTRAAQVPGYFVCRINGKPANDPCQRTSPADAYWSYWHARPGGSWTYSTIGPADYDPAPGTVEGWAFGAGKPPSSPPPPAPAAATTRPASSSAATRPPTTAAAAPTRPAPAPSAPAVSPGPSPAGGVAAPQPASPSPSSPSSTPAASTPPQAAPPPGAVTSRPNKYAGPVVAGVLVLLIVAAGLRRLRMRRRVDGS